MFSARLLAGKNYPEEAHNKCAYFIGYPPGVDEWTLYKLVAEYIVSTPKGHKHPFYVEEFYEFMSGLDIDPQELELFYDGQEW